MEILFRGFYADENGNEEIWTNGTCQGEKVKGKVNGEWIYWDKFGKLTKTLKVGKRIWGKGLRVDENDILPETVGQYTGLDDKNGKKIFEHDRIKYKCGELAEVIFTCYSAFVGITETLSHENIGGVLTEVIGTVFDKEEQL